MNYFLRTTLVCALGLFPASSGFAQGTFQNLGFESAHDIPVFDPRGHPWITSAADALPGWTCYLGTNQTGSAWCDDVALDSAAVGIQSTTSLWPPAGFISGQYCASLQYGYVFNGPYDYYFGPASIAQSGQIPLYARSIRFNSTYPFYVTFAGSGIPLVVLTAQANYNVYGGDISQFAGQTGELRITSYSSYLGGSFIDAIQFSSLRVPEPSTFCLVILGLGLFCRKARSKKRLLSP